MRAVLFVVVGVVGCAGRRRRVTEIARNRWRLKRCYNEALRASPTAEGVIRVQVSVDAAGNPTPATHCASAPPSLARCVTEAFRGMHFPAPDTGSATFVVPVVLKAKRPTGAATSP